MCVRREKRDGWDERGDVMESLGSVNCWVVFELQCSSFSLVGFFLIHKLCEGRGVARAASFSPGTVLVRPRSGAMPCQFGCGFLSPEDQVFHCKDCQTAHRVSPCNLLTSLFSPLLHFTSPECKHHLGLASVSSYLKSVGQIWWAACSGLLSIWQLCPELLQECQIREFAIPVSELVHLGRDTECWACMKGLRLTRTPKQASKNSVR